MSEAKDMNGWPIVPDARVYVPPRPGLCGGEVAGFGGLVRSATETVVELEELGSFNRRFVRPDQCSVQSGETKGSLEHRAIRRGGRQFLVSRVNQLKMREERNARKAELEDA